jgi:hypothetical protein
MHALVFTGTHGRDGVGSVVWDAEVTLSRAAPVLCYSSLSGGVPAATTEKAVVFPVMALWVAGCVVMEGALVVATGAIVIVAGEVEELLNTEMDPEVSPLGAGVDLSDMVVPCPSLREANPAHRETVRPDHWAPRPADESLR